MHNKAKELGEMLANKLASENICELTPQEYDNAKDISEIVKNLACLEKDYLIIEAMKKSEEEEELIKKLGIADNSRMGYRYGGRYVPNGMGRRGYDPYMHMSEDGYIEEYLNDPNFMDSDNHRMGYTHNGNISRYGYVFDDYRDKRRHYTDTHDPKVKEHRGKTMDAITEMISDVWKDMDMNEREVYRNKFMQLINQ